MYKHLYKYLLNSQILCKRQFGFQEGHSTDHAILQLVAQMHNNLNWNNFNLGVLINLFKASDAADH